MPLTRTDAKVTLAHPNGSSAEILLFGATVISWKAPAPRDARAPAERLYTSATALLDGSKPVRGGIPLVFPFFGPPTRPAHARLPQHGFARSHPWQFDAALADTPDAVSVRFLLHPSPAVTAKFSAAFSLAYVVTLGAHTLTTALHVTNPSPTDTLTFQALLHTYLRASPALATVTPLHGVTYVDKLKPGFPELVESREAVDLRDPADSVYKSAGGEYAVSYAASSHPGPGPGIDIKASGLDDLVLWNPGKDGKKIADLEDGGWDLFICVEPGAASYWIDLAPGSSWTGQQSLTLI